MIKKIFTIVLVLILSMGITPGVYGDEEDNALDYIPRDNFIGGWEAIGNEMLLGPSDVAFVLEDDLQLVLEYDLVWYASETYTNWQDEMTIEIFEFSSASDAYGFYMMSPVPYAEPDIVTGIVVEPYGLPPAPKIDTLRNVENIFLEGYKDKFYFRIYEENVPEDLTRIGLYLLADLPGMSIPADLIAVLPDGDRVRGTERYIKGPVGLDLLLQWRGDDIFGFEEYEWVAVTGEYRLGDGEYYLLLIAEYEDEEAGDAVCGLLQEYFQDSYWETVMLAPLENGIHPRGFRNETYAAFWADGEHIKLIWDLSDSSALFAALAQQGD